MRSKYIIQGYQVSELELEEIILASDTTGPDLTQDQIDDYSIEDYLTDQEQIEAGHLFNQ